MIDCLNGNNNISNKKQRKNEQTGQLFVLINFRRGGLSGLQVNAPLSESSYLGQPVALHLEDSPLFNQL
jgi:hypothetical protein